MAARLPNKGHNPHLAELLAAFDKICNDFWASLTLRSDQLKRDSLLTTPTSIAEGKQEATMEAQTSYPILMQPRVGLDLSITNSWVRGKMVLDLLPTRGWCDRPIGPTPCVLQDSPGAKILHIPKLGIG
ncbi:Hypothetical predicted protein [Pelobates cultripes]|uniref:Uncharacterized protein n=1 Tax=Pelobates cultripes TaxID=61616 RepID=A0AAD1VL91_PELCU|nr:Hypothetical predicted protein [Pelobates cultripes]